MESFRIILDDGSGHEFDKALRGPHILQDGGDIRVITKENATRDGNPVVLIDFSVDVNGEPMKAQTVTTVKLFLTAARAMATKYDMHDIF